MKPLRTIIVDDHAGFRRILKRFLCRYPFINVLDESGNAEETMERVQRLSPDLLTVDIHLPGEDGFELARSLQENNPGMKIIFISFDGNPAFQKKAEEMGCPYVAKERLLEELPAALERVNEYEQR